MSSLVALRRSLVDLRAPDRRVYFLDLAITSAVAYAALGVAASSSGVAAFVVGGGVAALALSRAALFAHELAHQRDAVPGLRLAWHVAIGVPFLFPSFIYEHVHREHHRLAVYRTARDPEHAPDTRPRWKRLAVSQSAALVFPGLLLARWSVVAPLSFVVPGGRAWVLRRFSSLTMNPLYVPPTRRAPHELWAELACMAWSWIALATMPWRALVAAWIALGIATAISDLRGEVLHRFGDDGERGTLERQVRDSVDLHARGLVRLFFPMGIGYHALHHLAPWLPYHALGAAHRRTRGLARADTG
ncbi:MAG: fatty acid desaturase [Labilithrix sp.]|nr:fatty acid desaturase [Labilithrix sp.]MCW5811011.1 fatty acid desaturase [Labilithrix sp.]